MEIDRETAALTAAIGQMLKHRIDVATNVVVEEAVADFRATLRANIAQTAMEVSNFYELHRDGANLVITVKHVEVPK